MGSFEWTGTVWKKFSKAVSVSVKDKKNEKKGERKNDYCLVTKNVETGQVWLLEESAIDRDVCENQVFLFTTQAFNVKPIRGFIHAGQLGVILHMQAKWWFKVGL